MTRLRHRRVRLAFWLFLSSSMLSPTGAAARRHPSTGSLDTGHSGTEEQIDDLVAEFGRLVFRVAFAITRNEALAEEVVQDTMFKAWTSMPSWEGDVPVKWLRTVARNGAISVMRKENRTTADEDWELRESHEPDTERVVEGRAMVAAMHVALAQLDEASRTMIVLRETDELSYEEIADVLEMTPTAVKAKLYRSRHKLKVLLREWAL